VQNIAWLHSLGDLAVKASKSLTLAEHTCDQISAVDGHHSTVDILDLIVDAFFIQNPDGDHSSRSRGDH